MAGPLSIDHRFYMLPNETPRHAPHANRRLPGGFNSCDYRSTDGRLNVNYPLIEECTYIVYVRDHKK